MFQKVMEFAFTRQSRPLRSYEHDANTNKLNLNREIKYESTNRRKSLS